jgi:polar amino acid transport system permease protein
MIAYFVIPSLIGITPSALITGIITLGLCSGAYASEVIRSTFNSIDQGQWFASQALGYSRWQQLVYVLGPQMAINAFPSLVNEYLMVLKSTSLLASIGIVELTKVGTNIMYRTFNPLPVCLGIALIYLVLSAFLTKLGALAERKLYVYR